MIHYFAYGSNLHPVRLMERVPSANLVAAVELNNHHLTFHKKSHDGSSKCNILDTGSGSNSVHGAIYELDPAHKSALDGFEGKGFGYLDNQISLQHQGREYNCFTYLAQESHIVDDLRPYHWYKNLVVLGARYLQFPDTYISSIESVESVEDPHEERRKEHELLIEKIINFQ
jgi:gamma-glutamylcyclotransferase